MTPSQTDDVRVGAVLGGTYEITSVLGEGGMGYVFAARHLRLPKQVAVKVLKTGFSLSPDIVARFRREAEIASRLGHPHIVEVLDFDTLPGGTPFLVLEFLKGESLGQRLARGPLSWEETREVALQVGSALLAAHGAGVVHRDLKPDNIFLLPGDSAGTSRHRVKLLDFGISKLSGGATVQTQDSILMGTPRYMSPEQALGKNAAIDARSDVFALACIYYEMLAGQAAFPGDNIPTVLYRIVHEMPRPLSERVPGLPPHVWPALERALAKEADARTRDVVTLTEALTGTRLFVRAEAAKPALPEGSAELSTLEALGATYVPPGPTPSPGAAAVPVDALGATHVPGATQDATYAPGAESGGNGVSPSATPPAAPVSPGGASEASAPAPAAHGPVLDGAALGSAHIPAAAAAAPPHARARVTPPPQHAAPTPAPGRTGMVLGGAGLIALSLGVASFASRQEPPKPAVVAVAPATALEPGPARPLPPPPPAPGAAEPAPPAQPPVERAPSAVERPAQRAAGAPRDKTLLEPTDETALSELKLAEQALGAGNPDEAVFRARRSLSAQRSGQAYSVLTQAHCSLNDLSNAQAQYQNVPRALQGGCRQWCARYDIQPETR
jgi:hypothetical protein